MFRYTLPLLLGALTACEGRDHEPPGADLLVTSDAPAWVRTADVNITVTAPGRSVRDVRVADAPTAAAGAGWGVRLTAERLRELTTEPVPQLCADAVAAAGTPEGRTGLAPIAVTATTWPDLEDLDACLLLLVDLTPSVLDDGAVVDFDATVPPVVPDTPGLEDVTLLVWTDDPSSVGSSVKLTVTGGQPAEQTFPLPDASSPREIAVDPLAGQSLLYAKLESGTASRVLQLVPGPEAASSAATVPQGGTLRVVFTAKGAVDSCRVRPTTTPLTWSSDELEATADAEGWRARSEAVVQDDRVTVVVSAGTASLGSTAVLTCRDAWDRRAETALTVGAALPTTATLELVASPIDALPGDTVALDVTGPATAATLPVTWAASAGTPPSGDGVLAADGTDAAASAEWLVPAEASGVVRLSATVEARRVDAFVRIAEPLSLFPAATTLRPGQEVTVIGLDGVAPYTCSASVVGAEALDTTTSSFVRDGTSLTFPSASPSIVISAKETVTTAAQATVRCEDRSGRSTTAKVTLEASPS